MNKFLLQSTLLPPVSEWCTLEKEKKIYSSWSYEAAACETACHHNPSESESAREYFITKVTFRRMGLGLRRKLIQSRMGLIFLINWSKFFMTLLHLQSLTPSSENATEIRVWICLVSGISIYKTEIVGYFKVQFHCLIVYTWKNHDKSRVRVYIRSENLPNFAVTPNCSVVLTISF